MIGASPIKTRWSQEVDSNDKCKPYQYRTARKIGASPIKTRMRKEVVRNDKCKSYQDRTAWNDRCKPYQNQEEARSCQER